jgi:hypothetical protein
VRVTLGGQTLFRNHSPLRPLLAALMFAWFAGFGRLAAVVIAVLAVSLVVPTPLQGYRASLGRLADTSHPLRTLGECLRSVDAAKRARGEAVFEPYAPARDAFLHSYFYYLRGSGWYEEPDDERLREAAFTPGLERPVIMDAADYVAFLSHADLPERLPTGLSRPGLVMLLPGDYARCRSAGGGWSQ